MRRILFVVPPLTGHVMPATALARELGDRGHVVAWSAFDDVVGHLLPAGQQVYEADADQVARETFDAAHRAAPDLRGSRALEFLWSTLLLPLARAMQPPVDAAVRDFQPDIMVVDQQAFAGAVIAAQHDIPWVTLATTSAELDDPLAELPQVGQWVQRQLEELRDAAGLHAPFDPRFSPEMLLVPSTSALTGPIQRFPDHWHFVGPLIGPRPSGHVAWDRVGPSPRVFVSLGTVRNDTGRRFLREAAAALAMVGAGGIVVAPSGVIDEPPPGVLVEQFVPQLDVVAKVDAVVSHGGHNTVVETLAAGKPLVLAPIRDDQPIVTQQVLAAGAGVRLKYARARRQHIATAIEHVVHSSEIRAAASAVAQSFEKAGRAPLAAQLIESLTS